MQENKKRTPVSRRPTPIESVKKFLGVYEFKSLTFNISYCALNSSAVFNGWQQKSIYTMKYYWFLSVRISQKIWAPDTGL